MTSLQLFMSIGTAATHPVRGCLGSPTPQGSAGCRPMALPPAPSGRGCQASGLHSLLAGGDKETLRLVTAQVTRPWWQSVLQPLQHSL